MTRTNYAITHRSEKNRGLRILTLGNQYGHFPTRELATEYMQTLLGPGGLERVLSPTEITSLRVVPAECYVHEGNHLRHGGCGDAVHSVFPDTKWAVEVTMRGPDGPVWKRVRGPRGTYVMDTEEGARLFMRKWYPDTHEGIRAVEVDPVLLHEECGEAVHEVDP